MKIMNMAAAVAALLMLTACDNGEKYGYARQAAIEAGYKNPEMAWVSVEEGYICKNGDAVGYAYAFKSNTEYGLVCVFKDGAKIVATTPEPAIMPELPYPLPTED